MSKTPWADFAIEGAIRMLTRGHADIEPLPPHGSDPWRETDNRSVRDWHVKWEEEEPECAGHQWRQRDRFAVINMADMSDNHLKHAIRFAATKRAHASKMGALLSERAKRSGIIRRHGDDPGASM